MKIKIIKLFFLLLITVITFIYTIKWLDSINLNIDKETLDILIESSENTSIKGNIINKIIKNVKNTKFINPVSLVIETYQIKNDKEDNIKEVINEYEGKEKIEINEPIVYIYNTHQGEKYNSTKEININYSVLDASYYLQTKLKKYGIESIVENNSISDVLSSNNWNYASSYRVSRMFLEERKKNNKSLKYYIDIHRDSVNKDISTVQINGKKYARVMLLLGLENDNYKENEKNIIELQNWLENNYKGLSRGIYRKKGKGVNGVYNQDFSSNCFLIEVGGEENNYEEVENTIDIIAEMFNYYIGEHNDKKNN